MSSSSSMKKCYCGVRASIDRSSTESNLGRQFFGCHNWMRDDCEFFEWIDLKYDEASSVRRRKWKQREGETSGLFGRKMTKLKVNNNEILMEILQLKSKWECFIMEFRRISMCLAIICVLTSVILRLFLGRFWFLLWNLGIEWSTV